MAPPAKNRAASASSSGSDKRSRPRGKPIADRAKPAADRAPPSKEVSKNPANSKRARDKSSSSTGSSRSGSSDSSSSSSGSDGSGSTSSSSGTESGSEGSGSPASKSSKKPSTNAKVTANDKDKKSRRSRSGSRGKVLRPSKQRSATPEKGRTGRDTAKTIAAKPAPILPATKLYISRLTHNVTKDHVAEIFGKFGKIKDVEMPMDPDHPTINRCVAQVEFENSEEALKAIKYMNGGQIDGQTIVASFSEKERQPDYAKERERGRDERDGGRKPPMGLQRFPSGSGGGSRVGANGARGIGLVAPGRGGVTRRDSPSRSGRRSRSRSPLSRYNSRRSRSTSRPRR